MKIILFYFIQLLRQATNYKCYSILNADSSNDGNNF